MLKKILLAGAAAAAFSSIVGVSAADAATYTLDFTLLPQGTAVTTQYPGVSVSLIGGYGATGPAVTGSFGTYLLGNSPTGNYPTANILDFAFSSDVKDISFYFNNFGTGYYCPGSRGCSTATTYDALGNLEGFTDVSGGAFSYGANGSVAGSTVRDLQFNNGSNDWEFGVGSITYTTVDAGVPEPSSWLLMLSGLGFIGYVMRRRVLRAA